VASILVCGSLIALHHTLDTDFKERISDVKIELIREKTAKLEKRIKGNVISSIDFEQIRKDEIEKYSMLSLLMIPIKLLPIASFFSLIFAFWVTKKSH
jgi:hypothetical protein